jgi:hypothetical protein
MRKLRLQLQDYRILVRILSGGRVPLFSGASAVILSGLAFCVTGIVVTLQHNSDGLDKWCHYLGICAESASLLLLLAGLMWLRTGLMTDQDAGRGESYARSERWGFISVVTGTFSWLLENILSVPYLRSSIGDFPPISIPFLHDGVLRVSLFGIVYCAKFLIVVGLLLFVFAVGDKSSATILRARVSTHRGLFRSARVLFAVLLLVSLLRLVFANPGQLEVVSNALLWIFLGLLLISVGHRLPQRERRLSLDLRAIGVVDAILSVPEDGRRVAASEYLSALRETIQTTEESFRRTMILLASLIFVFELLNLGIAKEMSPLGVKVKDLSVIQALLPPLVAYVYFELMSLVVLGTFSREAYKEILKRVNLSMVENGFDHYLLPSSSLSMSRILRQTEGPFRATVEVLFYPFLGALVLGPIGFELHAFQATVKDFPCSVLAWIGIGVSAVYLALGVLVFWQVVEGDI